MRFELKGDTNRRIKITIASDAHTSKSECDAFLINFERWLKQTYGMHDIERFLSKDGKIVILEKQ